MNTLIFSTRGGEGGKIIERILGTNKKHQLMDAAFEPVRLFTFF